MQPCKLKCLCGQHFRHVPFNILHTSVLGRAHAAHEYMRICTAPSIVHASLLYQRMCRAAATGPTSLVPDASRGLLPLSTISTQLPADTALFWTPKTGPKGVNPRKRPFTATSMAPSVHLPAKRSQPQKSCRRSKSKGQPSPCALNASGVPPGLSSHKNVPCTASNDAAPLPAAAACYTGVSQEAGCAG